MKKILALMTIISLAAFSLAITPGASAATNLVANGSFEEPIVGAPANWDIYVTAEIPGWDVEWVDAGPVEGRPAPMIELHRGVNGWLAQDGEQYSELDSDWDGPDGSLNGEPASVKISQDIDTGNGCKYELKFYFSPRPGTDEANNQLRVTWGGVEVDTISAAGDGNTVWSEHVYELTGNGGIMELGFADMGTSDSLGTFVDNISLELTEDCEECNSCNRNTINIISNDNAAIVGNHVEVSANTGGNYAGGSYAGDGGSGGDIRNRGDEVEDSTTGNGARGGNSGIGGTVVTGDATAEAGAINVVNTNKTDIETCCDENCCVEESDGRGCGLENIDLNVTYNRNRAIVGSHVGAAANTGYNFADGSQAGDGGEGGDIKNGGGDVEESNTGNGGVGGDSTDGGLVQTGTAVSRAGAINIVNTNITRISRAR